MPTRRTFLQLAVAVALPCCSDAERPGKGRATATVAPVSCAAPDAPSAEPPWSLAHLRKVHAALAPLQPFRPRAKPGEWLAEHPEPGQSFEAYAGSDPHAPTDARRTLVVCPLGALPAAKLEIVELARAYLGAHFGLPTRLGPRIDPDAPPAGARRVRDGETQLLTKWLLEDVLPPRLESDAAALIAFTDIDLYPEPSWNFVFGEASDRDPVGVWSLHRYGDPSAGAGARRLAMLRALKLAVHETGHIFSLPHCTAYPCVQAGVNSLDEDDASPLWLCADCLCKVAFVTKNDPRALLEGTKAFCSAHALDAEAAFFARSLAAIADV